MIKTPYIKFLLLIFALPLAANANFLLGIAEVLGLEVAQASPADDLSEAVGGESGNLGLQRPVTLRELPIDATFLVNSASTEPATCSSPNRMNLLTNLPFLSWGEL